MRRILKTTVSLVVVLSLLAGLFCAGGITVSAASSRSQAEAVAWINASVGQYRDYDGAYGAQCVDLIYYYYQYLGESPRGGNANDYISNSLPSGWTRIKYSSGFVAQPGDIAVWNTNQYSSVGHVALVSSATSSNMSVVEQNHDGSGTKAANAYTYSYTGNMNFWGVVRPAFSSSVPLKTPTITLNKTSFTMGETISLSWVPSPSDSNLSHYWISVYDSNDITCVNQKIDKSQTSFSFATPGVGTYKVKILATPVGSVSGEGSLTDTKTITIKEKPVTYTITYNANGGSGAPASQTKTHNVTATLSTVKPTRSGYTFKGWATSASATTAKYQAGASYTGNSNVTLYAVWEIKNPLKITKQPTNAYAQTDFVATVSLKAQGDGLTYKWYYCNRDDSSFKSTSSFTGNTYAVGMNEERAGRRVYCVVSDKYGNSVKSNTVTLCHTTSIIKQPESVCVGNNEEAAVEVVAEGDSLTFDWYYKNPGDANYTYTSSFTGSTYSIVMTNARANRMVYCVITDQYGNKVTTDEVALRQAVVILEQPESVCVKRGKAATVEVLAKGDSLKYSWYYKNKGDAKYTYTPSFTGSTYSAVMNDDRADRMVYCVITDEYGNKVTTDEVTLSQAVVISKQPQSVVAKNGKTASVSVKAKGETLKYKWYYKDKGQSTYKLATSFKGSKYSVAINASRAGRQVYCVVTDYYGNSVKSAVVTLNIAAKITTQPKSVKTAIGKTAKVTVKAIGSGLTYKWYYKNKGQSTYKLASSVKGGTYSVAMSNARAGRKVYCVVTDKYGNSVKSKIVTLNKK